MPQRRQSPLHLSAREQAIADLVGRGLGNQEIARRLSLSVRTVENYLRLIYLRLRLKNRSQLTRWVLVGADTDA